MIVQLMLLILLVLYFVYHFRRRRLYYLTSKFNGPKALPVFGNALECLMPLSEMHRALLRGTSRYKSPIRFWFGPYLVVYVSNPEHIKTVLNSQHALNKLPYMYNLGESIVGRGLLTLPVDEWKVHRKIISPFFNSNKLDRFFEILLKHSSKMVSEIKKEESNGVFDVEDYSMGCMLNIVLDTLLGFDLEENNFTCAQEMSALIKVLLSEIANRISNIWFYPDFIYKLSKSSKRFLDAKARYGVLIQSIIEHWKTKNKNDLEGPYSNNSANSKIPNNFVEPLLRRDGCEKFTNDELTNEINTLLVSGLESTASMMPYLWIMLGMHTDVQEKLYQEINCILGSKQFQNEDLKRMPYLDRVVKESLRLFPTGAAIARYNDEEIALDEKHTIPSKTNIFIGLLTLHRDATIWPNPNQFDPDRFLPEEVAKRHPYSWIPFSAGPRNCIGFQFALMVMKVVTVCLLRSYKITTPYKTVDDIDFAKILLLRPADGYKIGITGRRPQKF